MRTLHLIYFTLGSDGGFSALQTEAGGLIHDPSHVISWVSRCKQNGALRVVNHLAVVTCCGEK